MTFDSLFNFTSNAPIILFRWLFGAILFISSFSRCKANIRAFCGERIHIGFELTRFLRPLPVKAMRAIFWAEVPLCLALMLGVIWPWPALLLCLLHSYVFLLDASRYLNHKYLVCLLLALFCAVEGGQLSLVPLWQLVVFQFQFVIVYFYSGIGKLNRDWLIRGQPFQHHLSTFKAVSGRPWLRRRITPNFSIGRWLERVAMWRGTALVFCWAGCIFDLCIGPALLNQKLLPIVLPSFIAFHFFNQWFYGLGIFPFINYASVVLFLTPETIGFSQPRIVEEAVLIWPGMFLGCWAALQILVPLRRYVRTYLSPSGKVYIHSDHNRHFSWTMKLRETNVVGFAIELFDRRTGGRIGLLKLSKYLSPGAIYQCSRSPRAIVMALARIEPLLASDLGPEVGIRVRGCISFNGRPFVTPIDPNADLRGQRVKVFGDYPWHFLGG